MSESAATFLPAPTPKRGVPFLHRRILEPGFETQNVPASMVVTAVRCGCVYYAFAEGGGKEFCSIERWSEIAAAVPGAPDTTSKAPELTRADKDALERLPEGWFFVENVPFMVRNPRWRCDRLVRFKLLESEVVGPDIRNLKTRYRKLPLSSCQAGLDGDCCDPRCPQRRDREPSTSGRPCPLAQLAPRPDYAGD